MGKENKVISKRPQDLGGGASRFFIVLKRLKERGEGIITPQQSH